MLWFDVGFLLLFCQMLRSVETKMLSAIGRFVIVLFSLCFERKKNRLYLCVCVCLELSIELCALASLQKLLQLTIYINLYFIAHTKPATLILIFDFRHGTVLFEEDDFVIHGWRQRNVYNKRCVIYFGFFPNYIMVCFLSLNCWFARQHNADVEFCVTIYFLPMFTLLVKFFFVHVVLSLSLVHF